MPVRIAQGPKTSNSRNLTSVTICVIQVCRNIPGVANQQGRLITSCLLGHRGGNDCSTVIIEQEVPSNSKKQGWLFYGRLPTWTGECLESKLLENRLEESQRSSIIALELSYMLTFCMCKNWQYGMHRLSPLGHWLTAPLYLMHKQENIM